MRLKIKIDNKQIDLEVTCRTVGKADPTTIYEIRGVCDGEVVSLLVDPYAVSGDIESVKVYVEFNMDTGHLKYKQHTIEHKAAWIHDAVMEAWDGQDWLFAKPEPTLADDFGVYWPILLKTRECDRYDIIRIFMRTPHFYEVMVKWDITPAGLVQLINDSEAASNDSEAASNKDTK